MRFSTIATTLFLGTLASAQDAYQAPSGDNTMVAATWTLTKTVERVVQTVTATRGVNTTEPTMAPTTSSAVAPYATASMGVIPQQGNGTSVVNGTGAAGPSSGMPTGMPVSGADRVGLEMLSLMAVAGLVGLAL